MIDLGNMVKQSRLLFAVRLEVERGHNNLFNNTGVSLTDWREDGPDTFNSPRDCDETLVGILDLE